jgi:glycosyltransferase involved in cell wall biosynthesis
MKPKVQVIFPDSMSDPVGGMGVQFKHLYEILKNDINFYLSGFPDSSSPKNYVEVISPFPNIKHGSLNTLLGQSIYLYESLKHPKPDLIHAYDWTTYLAGVFLAKYHKVPLLISIQLSAKILREKTGICNCVDPTSVDGEWLYKMHEEIEAYGYKESTKIVCVSKDYAKHFSQFKDKIKIIPNGVTVEDWKKENTVIFPGENKIKVIYIGRFASMKSVDVLANVNVPKGIDLIFVGGAKGSDPVVIDEIEKGIQKDNIFYIGSAYEQEKIDILLHADAVIMPSKHEPFGIVALEAFASKSILLSSWVDGLGDFCNSNNSIYTSITKEGIEKALNKLLKLSKQEKESLILNGLKTCKKYTWEKSAKQYKKIYKSLTKK